MNLAILICEAYFHFLPSVWIMFIIVLYEGLLGGACYVNAFYRISQEVISRFLILCSVYVSLSVHGIFCGTWLVAYYNLKC